MNNNLELTALANEFKVTMNHAEEIFNRYMEVAIDQAISEAINELSDVDKMILLLGLMTGAVEDKIILDLEELLSGEDMNKNANDKFVQVPSRSRMSVSKSFVEEIATIQGDNFVIHILG
jgi:hypothetical protein